MALVNIGSVDSWTKVLACFDWTDMAFSLGGGSTHCSGRNRMVAILVTTFSSTFSWQWSHFDPKFVPLNANILALLQVMACHQAENDCKLRYKLWANKILISDFTLSFGGISYFITTPPPPPPDKMAAISQTMCSDAFSWMKSLIFLLKCHGLSNVCSEGSN